MSWRFIICLIVLTAALLPSTLASADKASDLHHALAAKQAEHAQLSQKEKKLGSEVTTLESNLVKVSKTLRDSEVSLSSTDQHLQALRQKKSACLNNLYKDQRAMGGLVSAARKYSQTSTPSMLIESSPIDAARASIIMKSMIPTLNHQSIYLKSQLAEINSIEKEIANQLQIQTKENNELNSKQDSLAILLEERKKVYQSTASERKAQEKEVAELTEKSRNLDELMQRLKEENKNKLKESKKTESALLLPNILLPVHGKVSIGFGHKDELGAESKGVTFTTRSGAQVIVPLAGTVKFAGPFQNYKQILIVEHQGGYHSLIAGLARIDTVVGASLEAGEPVGVAETSGSPQIYYELRQNGKPVNPQKLLVAQRKQEKS